MFSTQKNKNNIIPIYSVTRERFTMPSGRKRMMADDAFCKGPGKQASEAAFQDVNKAAKSIEANKKSSNVEGFSTAFTGENWMNGIIVIWEDSTGKVVGGQSGGIPYVLPEYRGKKLGREIQLIAFETGLKTINCGSFFSPEGLAARYSAHRFAVERAVEQGLNVPEEVLADYPELNVQHKI